MKKLSIFIFLLCNYIASAQQDSIFKYINAVQTEDGVLISFTIKGGITCTGVEVERSKDGISFDAIYEFVGVCGSISVDESYSFLDSSPEKNHLNYYRLELGSLGLYSTTLTVHSLDFSESGILVAPQPCTVDCKIWFRNFSNELFDLTVYDGQGRKSLQNSTTGNHFELNTKTLPPGVYLFTIQRDRETKHTGRLVVL
jgi:hypothetical protein